MSKTTPSSGGNTNLQQVGHQDQSAHSHGGQLAAATDGSAHAHDRDQEHCCGTAHWHEHAPVHSDSHDHGRDHDHDHDGSCCTPGAATLGALASPTVASDSVCTPIRILQMDCPTEEALIRNKLGAMASVKGMEFNLMQRVLTVTHAPDALAPVLDAIRSLDFTPEVAKAGGQLAAVPEAPAKPWWPLALAGLAAIASEAASWSGWDSRDG